MKKHTKKILAVALAVILSFSLIGTALAKHAPPPPPQTGSLTIIKTFEGIESLPSTLAFLVTGPSGYNQTFYISSFTQQENGSLTLRIDNLPVGPQGRGEYTVHEKHSGASVEGYDLDVNDRNQNKWVNAGENTNFFFHNKYTYQYATLNIVKNFSGIQTLPAGLTFTVSGPRGYATQTIGIGSFAVNGNAAVYTLTGLPKGNYSVVENNATAAGYTLVVTGDNGASKHIGKGETKTFTITNEYEAEQQQPTTGALTVTKSFAGDPVTVPANLSFTVTCAANNYSQTVAYTNFTGSSYTISDLLPGTYTVTESEADVDGYNLSTTYTGEVNTAEVTAGGTASITVTNTYEEQPVLPTTGSLTITKSFSGIAELPQELSFTVACAANEYSRTISYTNFTGSSYTISDLLPGTYTVTESEADVDGYNLSTTFVNNADSATIAAGGTGTIGVINTYSLPQAAPTGTLSVTKSVNNQEGGDTVFTFNYQITDSEETLDSGSFTLKNGETWTYDDTLAVGTSFTIEEDEDAMTANYSAVSEPISGTIAAGANAFTYVNTYNQPFIPQTVYYNLTLNWLEEGTGTVLKPATTTPYVQMAPYDASSIAEIENYTYVRAEGDALTGTMNSSKTITFYYTANAIEDETEEIEENDTPLAEVPEEEPIVEEPVVEETPVIDIETDEVPLDDVPQTGDTNNTGILWLILGAGLAGLTTLGFLGKKAKKTR